MIRELTEDLLSTLRSRATLQTLTTGVYLGQAPESQQYGYVTVWPIAERARHGHSVILDDTLWQVSVFHTSLVGMASIHEEIRNTLDDSTLGLNTLQQVGLLRQSTSPVVVDHEDELGTVYHQYVEYQVIVV